MKSFTVYHFTRTGSGKQARAILHAIAMHENKQSIRFIMENGEKVTVKRADIIAIETETDGDGTRCK